MKNECYMSRDSSPRSQYRLWSDRPVWGAGTGHPKFFGNGSGSILNVDAKHRDLVGLPPLGPRKCVKIAFKKGKWVITTRVQKQERLYPKITKKGLASCL